LTGGFQDFTTGLFYLLRGFQPQPDAAGVTFMDDIRRGYFKYCRKARLPADRGCLRRRFSQSGVVNVYARLPDELFGLYLGQDDLSFRNNPV